MIFSQEISLSGKFNLKKGKAIPNNVIQGLFDSDSDDDDETTKISQSKKDLLPLFVPSAAKKATSRAQLLKTESVSGSQESWKHHSREKKPGTAPDRKFVGKVVGELNLIVKCVG